jgi:hypothetical protein
MRDVRLSRAFKIVISPHMGCDMGQGKKERDTGAELPTPPEADHHIATLLELPQVMPHLFG